MSLTSERLDRIQPSLTIAISTVARRMIAEGKNVISLSQGEPDFQTPQNIKDAAIRAIEEGQTKYTDVSGTPALRKAVAEKFKRDAGLDYKPEEIIISTGAKQVLFNAMVATLNKDDEVVIPSPCWVSYPDIVTLADGKPVLVPCPQNNGFKLRPEDLDAAITPKTKLVMLNYPNNPTGAAPTEAELKALADVLRKHPHVWVICDDMYEHLVYGDFKHTTLAQVAPDLKDRVVTVSGVSKTYAMTGWRIGFAGGPKDLIRAMVNMQGQATAGVSTIGQAAAAAALDGPQDIVADMKAQYMRRRDMVVDALNRMPGISCHKPEGAFYVFPNIAGCLGKKTLAGTTIATDADFAMACLEEAHVALVAGGSFGMSPYLRISYATDDASLEEAMARMGKFVASLS